MYHVAINPGAWFLVHVRKYNTGLNFEVSQNNAKMLQRSEQSETIRLSVKAPWHIYTYKLAYYFIYFFLILCALASRDPKG